MALEHVFEHMAINVPNRDRAEKWYTEQLGLSVVRSVPGSMCFLADRSGRVVFELYSNPDHPVMNFDALHPLTFHVAFLVEDIAGEADRLVREGASVVEPIRNVNGDTMVMLRDPFGMGVQLMKRGRPMFQEGGRPE